MPLGRKPQSLGSRFSPTLVSFTLIGGQDVPVIVHHQLLLLRYELRRRSQQCGGSVKCPSGLSEPVLAKFEPTNSARRTATIANV
jgi:hypothetical protein